MDLILAAIEIGLLMAVAGLATWLVIELTEVL